MSTRTMRTTLGASLAVLMAAGSVVGLTADVPAHAVIPSPVTVFAQAFGPWSASSTAHPCVAFGSASDYDTRMASGSGTKSFANQKTDYAQASSGTRLARIDSSSSGKVTASVGATGLRSLAIDAVGSSTATRLAAGTCGDNGATALSWASSLADGSYKVNKAGWLDVTATKHSGDWASFTVDVVRPDESSFYPRPYGDLSGTEHVRAYIPAGSLVEVRAEATGSIALMGTASSAKDVASVSIRATVGLAGAAASGEAGAAKAKTAVVLPTTVACSGSTSRAGKAQVALTKYAKKKAASATITVNGKVKKRIAKVRAKSYGVALPATGAITIRTKLKLKSGATVAVKRSYSACH
ncbi:hypothetical protein [Nocardioides sp. Kera G14]|uniref:hypothetical protein n=1 Tax=Nocardioides sp. Kera G14 TaxID=2884264 RepID=UPI001D12EADC|nr:hypothetical protein [Nocardioides sp. Kera G14]UDY24428.1 hypothetical protein LH076_03745 [Nocardioides sp. Kera G14]